MATRPGIALRAQPPATLLQPFGLPETEMNDRVIPGYVCAGLEFIVA